MPLARRWIPTLAATTLVISMGCGAEPTRPTHPGGQAEPGSDVERQVLERLDDWTGDQTIGGISVHAEPPYSAASGNVCRWLVFTPATGATAAGRRRLACKKQGTWFYAPDVLVAPVARP